MLKTRNEDIITALLYLIHIWGGGANLNSVIHTGQVTSSSQG